MINNNKLDRYSRQILLNQIGTEGQKKLMSSSVLIIGAGGLGAPASLYLAAAGVGRIGIIDGDKIEKSNLQRQIIYSEEDIGKFKAEITHNKLNELNSDLKIESYLHYLNKDNISSICKDYDLIINGVDNFSTRYLVNDYCVEQNKHLIDGSVIMFEGQVTYYAPGQGCYRCLYPSPPKSEDSPNCSTSGVLGPLVGVIGTIQAVESIKVLLGIGDNLSTKLINYNALSSEFMILNKKKKEDCTVCSNNDYNIQLDYHRPKSKIKGEDLEIVTIEEFKELIKRDEERVQVLDVRDYQSYALEHIKNSKNIESKDIDNLIQKEEIVVIVCEVGEYSKEIQVELKNSGFKNIYTLEGGILQWKIDEEPLENSINI